MSATGDEGAAPRGLAVRRATRDDAAAIARVQVSSWRAAYRGLMPDALLDALNVTERAERWRQSWLAPADHGTLVVLVEGTLVGFCLLNASRDADAAEGTGEIVAIYVEPEHWRTGAGAALMLAGIEQARRRNDSTLTLWVLDTNQRARQFYERWGFVPDGAHKLAKVGEHSLSEVRYRLELRAAVQHAS